VQEKCKAKVIIEGFCLEPSLVMAVKDTAIKRCTSAHMLVAHAICIKRVASIGDSQSRIQNKEEQPTVPPHPWWHIAAVAVVTLSHTARFDA
jgi:hypothetical protein